MQVNCEFCGEHYPVKRKELGYRTCLDCGDLHAQEEKVAKSKRIAPAFNKGAYQLITSIDCVRNIFKCGESK